jgi:hypothetical protein
MIEFLIETDDDASKSIRADRSALSKKSEYFNILLNGQFHESLTNSKRIKLADVPGFHVVQSLFCILQGSNLDLDLDFRTCLGLVEACDRFMLFDIKLAVCSFVAVHYLDKCTFLDCWTSACKYDCKYLLNACVDFLLTFDNDLVSDDDSQLAKDVKHSESFVEFCYLFKKCLQISAEHACLGHFKDTLKLALSDIIKHNSWKF